MPVRRFRRVEDMERPLWRKPGDPKLYRAIAALWDYGQKTSTIRFPPGLYRYRCIEDMAARTESWHRQTHHKSQEET